jgi:hypothetical protein
MRFWSAERLASIAIGILLLALVRSLGEYLRLKHVYGQGPAIARMEPFIIGSLVAAFFSALAFALYAWRRYRSAIAVCIATLVALLVYKILTIS